MCGLPLAACLSPLTVGRRNSHARPGTRFAARAEAVDIPVAQNLATRADLLQVKVEINDRIARTNDRSAAVEGKIVDEFKALYRYLLVIAASSITVIFTLTKLFP